MSPKIKKLFPFKALPSLKYIPHEFVAQNTLHRTIKFCYHKASMALTKIMDKI